MILLAVPRAPVGRAQPRLHPDQVEEPFAAAGGRHRPADGRALGHGVAGAPLTAPLGGACVALGSVLVIRSTCSVVGSNRPKLGSTSISPVWLCTQSWNALVEACCRILSRACSNG